ncbi:MULTISPECIES: hypothetical protein [unclassified Rhodococcus (in: high G+C Gram-positive bacteria)]|uniref:hypothetical protein n=1 Tax=unclassified Rhodococcus (in: high G+C Gram-positive bacteria) TaxID=192944 RepID=UPI001C9B0789|nr:MULTISPECIES: hypothetical protein [unclassified Rhodococcus (in: high G+C Gram-positive bacteria)]MBY6709188.1 hypothetical protein [Rhodococcus sp. BP-241]
MTYSRVESDLVAMALDRSAPSDLAVEAMVSGVPVEETLPRAATPGAVDVVWVPEDMPDL